MQTITLIIKLLCVRVKLSCSNTLDLKEKNQKPPPLPPNSLMASPSFCFPQYKLKSCSVFQDALYFMSHKIAHISFLLLL